MIEVKNLVKKYGENYALDDVSFTVEKGEIVGFLGPNGAGKTTTMNILTGYISSTSGSASVDGFDILKQPFEVKKRIGYLPENPPLYFDMLVSEYLNFVYDLKKVKTENRSEHIQKIMDVVKINDVANRKIANLSKGYKQRVGFAQALIGNPEVLILDEPTVGLDPAQIIEIRNLIKELGKERTIILSSHILPEVSAVCERILIIDKGKLIASDTTEHLISQYTNHNKLFLIVESAEEAESLLEQTSGVTEVVLNKTNDDGTMEFYVTLETPDVRKEIMKNLSEHNVSVLTIKNVELSLEDIFIKLISGKTDSAENTEENTSNNDIDDVEKSDEINEPKDDSDNADDAQESDVAEEIQDSEEKGEGSDESNL